MKDDAVKKKLKQYEIIFLVTDLKKLVSKLIQLYFRW